MGLSGLENKDLRVKGMAIRTSEATMEARKGTEDDGPEIITILTCNSPPAEDSRKVDIRFLVKGALFRVSSQIFDGQK